MAFQINLDELMSWERERERERAVQKCLDTENDEFIPDLNTEDILPIWMMKCIQYTVIFLFGFILVLAIFALALYVADVDSQSLDGEFIEVADYICGALSLFVIGSSFVGLYTHSL